MPIMRGLALLKTLDWADFDLLAPHFRQVALKQGSLLQEQEAPVERNVTLRYKEALITTRLPKGMQP